MKIKRRIQKELPLQADVLEAKINNYLEKNFYRVVDRGAGYVIFIDDEYSDRKTYRSDFHTRIGEGKFEFYATEQGATIKLTYFTPVLYPFFLMMVFVASGMYFKFVAPIFMSLALTLPVLYKFYYLNEHVFNEVLEC